MTRTAPLILSVVFLAACATPTRMAAPPGCPAPGAGTRSLAVGTQGFCLLYPDGYQLDEPTPEELVIFKGSLQSVEDPRLYIRVAETTAADAETLADEVNQEVTGGLPGIEVKRMPATLGGEPAVVLDGLPGQDISRQVLAVHAGRSYRLTFVPADPATGDVYRRMEEMYNVVMGSFAYMERAPSGN